MPCMTLIVAVYDVNHPPRSIIHMDPQVLQILPYHLCLPSQPSRVKTNGTLYNLIDQNNSAFSSNHRMNLVVNTHVLHKLLVEATSFCTGLLYNTPVIRLGLQLIKRRGSLYQSSSSGSQCRDGGQFIYLTMGLSSHHNAIIIMWSHSLWF